MEIKNIKEKNDKKLERYEILLEKVYDDVSELKIENNKLYMDYNKKNKKIRKILNIGGISFVVILTIPIASQSLLAGISLGGYFLGELKLSQSSIKTFINKKNIINKSIKKSQEISELEKFKINLENSIYVREILKAILNNEYIAIYELENIYNIFNDNNILQDFETDDYSILSRYIKDFNNNFVKQKQK